MKQASTVGVMASTLFVQRLIAEGATPEAIYKALSDEKLMQTLAALLRADCGNVLVLKPLAA